MRLKSNDLSFYSGGLTKAEMSSLKAGTSDATLPEVIVSSSYSQVWGMSYSDWSSIWGYYNSIGFPFSQPMGGASGTWGSSGGGGGTTPTLGDGLTLGADVNGTTWGALAKLISQPSLLNQLSKIAGIVGLSGSMATLTEHYLENGISGLTWGDYATLTAVIATAISLATGEGEVAAGLWSVGSDIFNFFGISQTPITAQPAS